MSVPFLFIEIASLFFFSLSLLETRKKSSARLLEFIMIFFYALLLEELDQRIFKSYHYDPRFVLTIGQVPICIAWLWAMILASSMAISDAWGIPQKIRPFSDALLAVWIDLSIDAIAIRMGFWNWVIPLNEGWFGVPAGNLYAWMWVAFFYSALARILRFLTQRNEKWKWGYLALPFFAYLGLFGAMTSLGFIAKALGFTTQGERLIVFWVQFFIFLTIVFSAWKRRRPAGERVASVWWWGRFSIHFYFLFAFFFFGIFRSVPILGAVALFVLAGEFLFHHQAKEIR